MTLIKVGYGSMDEGFKAPGDRRRFAGFAIRNGLDICRIQDRSQDNDVVVLTLGSDLSVWKNLKKKNGAVVIDLVDAYLDEQRWSVRSLLRGSYKSVTRQIQKPTLSYRKMLCRALTGVEAVMCASIEQRERLLEYNSNVFVTVDCLEELFGETKIKIRSDNKLRLLWEGFPENLQHFNSVTEEIRHLAKHFELSLEVVTDLSGLRRRSSARINQFQKLMANIGVTVTWKSWSVEELMQSASQCDFGVIPIDERDPMAWLKSENKLLSFWALGLPVLTSHTPSYRRVMNQMSGNEDMANTSNWIMQVTELCSDTESLNEYISRAQKFARDLTSELVTDSNWAKFLESVIKI